MNMYAGCTHRGDSNEYPQQTMNLKKIDKISLNLSHLPSDMALCRIKPQWLELPVSRTYFHSPKDIRAIEVRL